jgi:hypothetical protein
MNIMLRRKACFPIELSMFKAGIDDEPDQNECKEEL